MAYLEKKILVAIPVTEAHKTYLEKQASSGKYNCQFRYIPKEHVTKEDLEDTQVLIGNLPPALVREAKRLEWLQLSELHNVSLFQQNTHVALELCDLLLVQMIQDQQHILSGRT